MSKFRKKPVVIEAHQWRRNGDHPDDFSDQPDLGIGPSTREGAVPPSRQPSARASAMETSSPRGASRGPPAATLGIDDPEDSTPCWDDVIDAARAEGRRAGLLEAARMAAAEAAAEPDCPSCPGGGGRAHKLSCPVGGAQQVSLTGTTIGPEPADVAEGIDRRRLR